ncbi:MAG: GntR family transcriptional regulator [Huintestinicola sp.]
MKKFETVANALREEIMTGVYPEGTALPTEEQLTELYGVSRQTVRRALSELVERELIVKRQGSGSLVRRRSNVTKSGIIAVIATYIDDYIFPSQLRAVEEVLSENKYSAVLSATRNRVCTERAILEDLLNKSVDGILIEGTKTAMPNPNFDLYEKLMNRNIPIVFFNSYYPELSGTVSVCADNRGGGYTLAEHLIDSGHTRIAGCFKSDDIQGHQRYSGFISALFEHNMIIPDEKVIWYTTETKNSIFDDKQKVLEAVGDATAVVCYNDEIAFNLIKNLVAAGRRVPEDVAVVSFDNSNLSEIAPVTITSLSYEKRNIGGIAARKLIDLINGKKAASETVPWTFIKKNSS